MDQYYNIESLQKINLGRQGENSVLTVKINLQPWVTEYPNAQFSILVVRPTERTPYFADTTFENGILSWNIRSADVGIAGTGAGEIRAMEGDVIKKSKLFQTTIEACLPGTASPTPPVDAPSWVDDILDSRAEEFRLSPQGHLIVRKIDQTEEDLGQVSPNDNKNMLFVQSSVTNFYYDYASIDPLTFFLSLKRNGEECLAYRTHAKETTGTNTRMYSLEPGDVLRIGNTNLQMPRAKIVVVLNGAVVVNTTVELDEDIAYFPMFSYTVQENDSIVVFWENVKEEQAQTTAKVIVNSAWEYDSAEELIHADFGVDGNSLIRFGGDNSDPSNEMYIEIPQDQVIMLAQSYDFDCTDDPEIRLEQSRRGSSAEHDAIVQFIVNGIALYTGKYNKNIGQDITLFEYTPKPGDLIVINWFRVVEGSTTSAIVGTAIVGSSYVG